MQLTWDPSSLPCASLFGRGGGSPGCSHPYLVGVVAVQPALDVGGVPAWHQAAVLQGPELRSSLGSRRDHLVEGVFQGNWVVMSSLVLSGMSKAGFFLGQPKSWAAHEIPQLPGHDAVSSHVFFSQKVQHPQPPHLPNQADRGKPLAHPPQVRGEAGSSPDTRSRLDLQG